MMTIKNTVGENIFAVLNYIFLSLLMIVTLYPFLYVGFASVSDPVEVMLHRGPIWKPLGFSLDAYRLVFTHRLLVSAYRNTVLYVSAGTLVSLILTTLGAYVLSRKDVYWKKHLMIMIVITMFFGGGLIPTYLLVRSLGMLNTIWAIILPGAVGTWNLIIMRTSFQAIPDSLIESAKMDGADDFLVLIKIVLPLSLPVIAVMVLFYAVGQWNSWFSAMIYLRKPELYPLQLVLREILISQNLEQMMEDTTFFEFKPLEETLKYATIMVATIPILCVYPFLQRFFVKGVMIGAIKG